MAYLVDTHLLLWVAQGAADKVPMRLRKLMDKEDEDSFVSAVSGFEIATKYRLGKLPEGEELVRDFTGWVNRLGFRLMSISSEHAVYAGSYAAVHRDPFDRLLAAQAALEGMILLSRDTMLDQFGVRRVW